METQTANIFSRQMTRIRSVLLRPEDHNGNNIIRQSIGDFLAPYRQYRYIEQISKIRALCPTIEEKKRNHEMIASLKKSLPAGIVSGVAVGGIGEKDIIERNNVIGIDIDATDNPAIYDWEAVKKEVGKSPYVAYAGLSVSGLGIFLLIPIKDATKHKQHFDAIVNDFAHNTFVIMQDKDSEPTIIHGLKVDSAPSNIASKRFVSYDPHPHWNQAAQVYEKTIEPVKLYAPQFTYYNKGKQFDVEAFLIAHGVAYNERERHGGVQYIVTCPWSQLHSSRSQAESAVFVDADGKPGYKCMHSHCADKHWQEFREFYEPNAYQRKHTASFPRLSEVNIDDYCTPETISHVMTEQEQRLQMMIEKNPAIGLLVSGLNLEVIEDAV